VSFHAMIVTGRCGLTSECHSTCSMHLYYSNSCKDKICFLFVLKGLGAIRAKIGPTSDVDKIFSKMYSQYVLFINKYS
jgi:hypothetical protein